MSISYKKIYSMIESLIEDSHEFTEDQKEHLERICKRIYMIESSSDLSSNAVIRDIKGEIALFADKF